MSATQHLSKGEITVRPASVDDAAALRELRLEALADYPEAFAADYDLTAAEGPEKWAERVISFAAKDLGMICLAAAGERLVGMTGVNRGNWPKNYHSGWIWGVYVSPEWRGLGAAEALIEACIDWGRGHGLKVVKLGVLTSNTPAIRCYHRCGFKIFGVEPKAIYYNGVYHDEFLMARDV
jgi:RimJ/RimL family protein N-acetyltransferase